MNTNINFIEFNLKKLEHRSVSLILSNNEVLTTNFFLDIIKTINNNENTYVFCNPSNSVHYADLSVKIIDKDHKDKIYKLCNNHRKNYDIENQIQLFLILDNCFDEIYYINALICKLFNYKQYNVSTIFALSNISQLAYSLRNQFDYIFLYNNNNNIDNFYKYFDFLETKITEILKKLNDNINKENKSILYINDLYLTDSENILFIVVEMARGKENIYKYSKNINKHKSVITINENKDISYNILNQELKRTENTSHLGNVPNVINNINNIADIVYKNNKNICNNITIENDNINNYVNLLNKYNYSTFDTFNMNEFINTKDNSVNFENGKNSIVSYQSCNIWDIYNYLSICGEYIVETLKPIIQSSV